MNRAERRAAARRRRRGEVDVAITFSVDPVTGLMVTTSEEIRPGDDPRAAFERNMDRAETHLQEWGPT